MRQEHMTTSGAAAPHFLLVGNGPYSNRGCEAIVRGTMAILRAAFGDAVTATLGTYGQYDEIAAQARAETDPALTHVCLSTVPRWTLQWWLWQGHHRLHLPLGGPLPMLAGPSRRAVAALEIGGDNYTLDYGLPTKFLALDRYLQECELPVALWGASIGPFDDNAEFADRMFSHLRSLDALYVRESTTVEYLRRHGVCDNVREVADPAFALEATAPPAEVVADLQPDGAIGFNVSPLLARFATAGEVSRWRALCSRALESLCRETDREIVLIPHVTSPLPASDDHCLLASLLESLDRRLSGRVRCAPPTLSAAETKWLIARCAVFVGARTHATIAALSSQVPTVSLIYSNKGRGLNDDLLGTRDYCVEPGTITPEQIVSATCRALRNAATLRQRLAERVPLMRRCAFAAGELLKSLITAPEGHGAQASVSRTKPCGEGSASV